MLNNSKRILSILMSVIMIVTSAVSAAVSSGAVEEITAAFESTSKETTGNYYPDETTASTVPDTGVTYPSTHLGTTTASTDGQPLLGDVDGDGYTTSADARLILRQAAFLDSIDILNKNQQIAGDVSFDGKFSAVDARLILRMSAEIETIDRQAPVRKNLDTERSSDTEIITNTTSWVNPGDTITVTISGRNIAGLTQANFVFTYDETVLEFVSISKAGNATYDMGAGDKVADGKFTWALFYMDVCMADQGIAVITFKTLKTTATQINYKITTWEGTGIPKDGTISLTPTAETTTTRPPETTTDTHPVTRPPLTVPPETTTAPNTSVILSSNISELKNISVGDKFKITFSAKNLSNIYYAYFDINVDNNYLKITGATRPEYAYFGGLDGVEQNNAFWGFNYDLAPGYCESIFCTVTFEAIKAGTTEIRFSAKTGSKTATTLDVTELTEILVINERTSEETTTAERTTIDKTTTTERTTHYNETTTGSGTTDGGLDPHPGVNIIIFNFTVIIGSGITPDDFRNNVYNNIVTILSSDGKVLDDTLFIGTGCTVCIYDSQGNILFRYDVSVRYDINGDGKITAADARLALRASAKIDTIDGIYAIAADSNNDGKITAMDARTILRIAAGLEKTETGTDTDPGTESVSPDFDRLSELITLTFGNSFNPDKADTAYVIDNLILANILCPAYNAYFSRDSYQALGEGNTIKDPLDKFSCHYYKIPVQNVKWICENIYNIEFDMNYTSANGSSYYYDGYIYAFYPQSGSGPWEYKTQIEYSHLLDSGHYEIIASYLESDNFGESFDYETSLIIHAEWKQIDGRYDWVFESVNELRAIY